MEYAIIIYPSHNRVYYKSSLKLSISELKLADNRISTAVNDAEIRKIGGINWVVFNTDEELNADDLKLLAKLSFVFAIFKISGDAMLPLDTGFSDYLGEDLVTRLKYPGKTNEVFTRLLINAACFSCSTNTNERLSLLDPLAGRGTTLFQGVNLGLNVTGVEIDRKAVEVSLAFALRYFKENRIKHKLSQTKISYKNKRIADINDIVFSVDKDGYKQDPRVLNIIRGDTRQIGRFIKKSSIDMIAADLPYGVAHQNKTQNNKGSRNPSELLKEALPVWRDALKKGGSIAISLNTHLLKRHEAYEIMTESGFAVSDGDIYSEFAHRVDQSIARDIAVAVKA